MDEIALTIGNFDGVHLGHQALLKRLKEKGKKTIVVTFSNHPSEILREKSVKLIITLKHRLKLLQVVDAVIVKEFTRELSCLSAYDFLKGLKEEISFSTLILGKEARLGRNREAGCLEIDQIANKLGFEFEPFAPYCEGGTICSSSVIRKCLSEGNLQVVSSFLGRPFSLLSQVQPGDGLGRLIGFKTINLPIDSLVLPPLGVYIVAIKHQGLIYKGVANLGYAPTLKNMPHPLLEVHILDNDKSFEGEIEVIFHKFLREERKFLSLKELKNQIALDIEQTKNFIN